MFTIPINAHYSVSAASGDPPEKALMAESSSSGEEDFRNETKYKQFAAAVERALKGFEVSSEWHDLISSLARLNKASSRCTRERSQNTVVS